MFKKIFNTLKNWYTKNWEKSELSSFSTRELRDIGLNEEVFSVEKTYRFYLLMIYR